MAQAATGPDRQAVMWEVRLREGDLDADGLRQFERWRLATTANAQAWDGLQERLARMGGGGRAAQGAGLAMAQALRAPPVDRRQALRAGLGLLVLGVGAWSVGQGVHQLGLDADWRSAIGERGEGVLEDGSALSYDADSRIYLVDGGAGLDLRQGQLLLKAAPRSGRELSVSTSHGTMVTAGAVINVTQMRQRSLVAVSEGNAVLHGAGRAPLAIEAGRSFYFDGQRAWECELPFAAVSAWTRGVVVADRMPLAELLEVFARYRGGLLRATGKAATRQISGVFRLDDIERALLQVVEALPVRLSRYGRYLTVIS